MKYTITGYTKTFSGATLHRIIAVRDIPPHNVKEGDLGGWIEKEDNLSQDGDAWVSGDAQVSGTAQVSDNAQVSGDAQVFGNARVSGDAQVFGNARVSDNAQVFGNARVFGIAWVSGNAQVFGTAWVSGDAQVSSNARVCGIAWVSGHARVDALENEINALRAKNRWIPVEERMPTEEDADRHGYVQWWSENEVAIPVAHCWDFPFAHFWEFTGVTFTHWRRIDNPEGL
jgi:hypothetical protein